MYPLHLITKLKKLRFHPKFELSLDYTVKMMSKLQPMSTSSRLSNISGMPEADLPDSFSQCFL